MNMIEKVARVFSANFDNDGDNWVDYVDEARAAIEAMKDVDNPTAFAGAEKMRWIEGGDEVVYKADACGRIFNAMITAALSEGE